MTTPTHLPITTDAAADKGASLAIVLLSRGAAYANGATELAELAQRLHTAVTAQGRSLLMVQPAFVDRSQPALPEALDLCAAAQTIVILPVMVPDEPSLRRWLHKLIMRWRASHVGIDDRPRLIFAQPLLQTPQLADVLALTVQEVLTRPDAQDVPGVVGDDDWEHDPKGWSMVPEHQHHVLWCMGPRCAAKGAVQLWPELAHTVRESPGLKKKVMLLQTSCQYPCNHGPLMIVYPGGQWYGPMDRSNIAPVLSQHVLHDQVNEDLRVHGPRTVVRI
ncbi:(2Fe-2S) ferredoxin domain-containing protein [Pantoea sp. 18069]|uniref:(2Fe-2S) ferredoxin domain-containing protein n=1 Tax=Pantoea sp. 18069 TaxID=2681415 RepID=UPI001356CEFB|nr:(2Fe-2S) ferredoxin domain-containing protein [Pantoea sp. 18069]